MNHNFFQDIELESTNTSTNLVLVEIHDDTSTIEQTDTSKYVGKIVCPICSEKIAVPRSHTKRKNVTGKPWWNTSGFDNHLKETHKTYSLDEHCEYYCIFDNDNFHRYCKTSKIFG